MEMIDISASIVLYKNDQDILKQAIDSFLRTDHKVRLYLVDNSPTDQLSRIVNDPRIEYIFTGNNLGFGKAHNIAIKKAIAHCKYYLVLNPDISFPKESLAALYDFMESDRSIGLVSPRILSFEGEMQYLCKRIPTPGDLFLRRFGFPFFKALSRKRSYYYEMNDMDYEKQFEPPTISGCFMFFRSSALQKIGLFDERYFMYMEDIDISRRMFKHGRNMYFPGAHIYHKHERASYKINGLLFTHISSAIKYFSKWGWFFDPDRKMMNRGS